VLKTFKYRLYPTKRQQQLLNEQLDELRWLWNTLLAERKIAWEERQEAIDYFEQKAEVPGLKVDVRPGLKQVHSQVAQDVALRLKKAMDAFFRRLKAGENPGYPRLRSKGRYDSLAEKGFRPPQVAGFQPARSGVCVLEPFRFCADQAE
jgi:putative transposase